MNIPMKLTVTRIILTPVFLLVFFLPIWLKGFVDAQMLQSLSVISAWSLLAIALVCELTDFLDGYIARKYNMVSDLGKVLDPFSDVLIHVTYFICFTFVGLMPVWTLTFIVYRELGITMVRMLSMQQGIALPANWWGKIKTVLYAITGIMGIIYVIYDRAFGMGLYSGVRAIEVASGEAAVALQASVAFWAIPVLYIGFALSAIASIVSFVTYAIPFAKNYGKKGK